MVKTKTTGQSSLWLGKNLRNLRIWVTGFVALFLFISTLVLPALSPDSATAATSSTLNFQARLLAASGALVADGTYNIEFKLYDSSAAGSSAQGVCVGGATDDCLWVETRTGGDKVTVINGYLSVNLASVTSFGALDWDQEMWLTMNIGGTGAASWDGEMTPRIKLTAVPYAFKAGTALGVSSNATSTASTNSGNVTVGTGNATGATSNSGNLTVDVGTATGTAGTISVGTSNTSAITIGRTGVTTTNNGALTVAQLITGQLGASITGGTVSINASSNNTTNINTGTSTGAVTIGGGSGTFAVDSTAFDVSTAGALSGITGYAQASGNFLQSGAGTFGTGTGAVSLNGDTTIAAGKSLTIATGATFTNASSTLNTAISISDVAGGGNIGTAAATVDVATTFNVNQTTGSQTLTLPSPTVTTAGRIVYVSNVGSTSFTMYSKTVATGTTEAFIWNGTAWTGNNASASSGVTTIGAIDSQTKSANGAVISGSSIYLQTADASNVGLVSTSTQTFAGAKTFSSLVTASAGVTIATGSTFTNASSTLFTAIAISDLPTGGTIGTAAATVDVATTFTVNQTTTSQTLTLPSPTVTTAGRVVYVTNIGSTSFVMGTVTLQTGSTAIYVWNGSAWTVAGLDGTANSTLQVAYNSSTGSTTPEILLDSTRGGIDIQDANTTIGATETLLAVRASATASTLGTGLFVVNASGKVGIATGSTSTTPTLSYDLSFGQGANRTIGVETQSTVATAGNNLTVTSGTGNTTGAGGTLTLQAGVGGTSGAGGAVAINGGASGGGNTAGGAVSVSGGTGGSGGTSGTGGALSLQGGTGGAVAGAAGGATSLIGGAGSSTGSGGAGGALTITGGAANGDGTTGRAGGSVTITGGLSKGTQTGGSVTIQGGAATVGQGGTTTISGGAGGLTGAGGTVAITSGTAGTSAGAAGGAITITASNGSSTTTGGIGGSITVNAGNAAGTGDNNGGSITFGGGAATGNGTDGSVIFKPQSGADSSTAVLFQNAAGSNILAVDTSSQILQPGSQGVVTTQTIANNTSTPGLGSPQYFAVSQAQDGLVQYLNKSTSTDMVYFTKCSNAACSSRSTTSALTSAVVTGTTDYSVVTQANGLPMIWYKDAVSNVLYRMNCGNDTCSAGNAAAVAANASNSPGGTVNTIVAPNGNVWAFYKVTTGSDLGLTKCTDSTCSTDSDSTPYTTGTTGEAPQPALSYCSEADRAASRNPNACVLVAHITLSASDDIVLSLCNADCSSMTSTVIDEAYDMGSNNNSNNVNLVMLPNGVPVIFRLITGNRIEVIKCDNLSCASPTSSILVNGTAGTSGFGAVLGSNGLPLVTYDDNTSSYLTAIQCGAESCDPALGLNTTTTYNGTGGMPTVSSGLSSNVIIGGDGFPLIISRTSSTFNHTHCVDLSCSQSSVYGAGSTGISLGTISNPFSRIYATTINDGDTAASFSVDQNGLVSANALKSDTAGNVTISSNTATALKVKVAATGSTLFNIDASTPAISATGTSATSNFFTVTNNALTTGDALNISSTSTGLTSGSLLYVTSATTGAVATDGIISLNATGNYTSTSNAALLDVKANSTAAGTIQNVQGNALTTGVGLRVASTGTGLTSGSLILASSATTGAVATNGIVSVQASGNYTSTSNVGALSVQANSTAAGTVQNISANALTTGVGLHVASTGTGLTSGSLLYVTSATTGAVATNGIISLNATGNYTSSSGAGLLDVKANSTAAGTIARIQGNALTTGDALAITSTGTGLTSGSLLYVSTATTGAVATDGVVSVNATGNYTSTSNAGLVDVKADSTAAGTIQNISGNALTTGVGLRVASTGTGLTSGSLLVLTSATTGAVATNGIASIQASGNYTSTSNVGALSVQANSTAAGTIQNISGNALTTGVGLHIASTGTGLTSGSLLYVTSATTGAVATNGIISLNATGNYTSTSNSGLLDVKANSTTAGTVVNIQGNALTTGTALNVSSTGVMTTTGNVATFTANSATTATGVVTINATGLTTGAALDINANTSANAITLNGNIQFDTDATRTITVQTQDTAATAGSNLTISAATGNTSGTGGTLTLQGGTGGASAAGGAVLVTGGTAGGGNTNGGNVTISGGTGAGTGVQGLVVLTTPTFDTSTVQNFTASASITQANVDSKSAILISSNAAGYTATLNSPTITTAGRVIYVTNSGSYDMTLSVNGGGTGNTVTLKPNTTATMIWNGSAWTAAGASSSTDLQAAYDNTATSAGGAELVLAASGGSADGLTVRNNTTTAITGALLEVQTSIGSNLFSVNNNATEYANNGGAESSTFTMWTDSSSGGAETTGRTTTANTFATGQAAASVLTTGVATQGIANQLSTTLTNSLKYQVSFAIKASSTAFTSLDVMYTYDGTKTANSANMRHCVSGTAYYSAGTSVTATQSTTTITASSSIFTSAMVGMTVVFANGQSAVISAVGGTTATVLTSQTVSTAQSFNVYSAGYTVNTNAWSRVTCTFTAPATGTTITSSNAVLIRQTDTTTRTFYVDNLSVTVSADVNHAVDGSVDSALGTNWQAYDADGGAGTSTAARDTTTIYDTSGSVSATTTAGSAEGEGLRNNMTITPSVSTQYLVTFYAKSSTSFSDIKVGFLPAGGSSTPVSAQLCGDYNTQTVSTSSWTKITCIFTTPSSGITDPDLVIYQGSAAARVFYVDALSITLNTNNSNNVQIGGANKGGPVTLLTLDRSSSAPIAASNDAYLGSMYYDTSTGRIQCYEADGWGACGAAPDNVVNLNPEYSGAVLNGTGVGTMTADSCGNGGGLSLNTSLCASGEARNYYKWTSPQATQQTYSIYVTYQLPATFKNFASDDTVQLTARTDSTSNAAVTYEMYKSQSGSISQCGSGETTVVTSANTWQTVGINGNESTSCSFSTSSANAFIIFKINVKANSNANAYVGTLSFTTTGN